jgi:predicted dehydrogenase
LTNTFVKERPDGDGGTGQVTVDDCALFLGRFSGGAVASFEATRYALGRKNSMRLEINGSKASLAFDFESMNELSFYDGGQPATESGFRRILVTEPEHPYVGVWWPPGHLLGYEHTFTNEVADLLTAIGEGTDPEPSFEDGLRVQMVLDAVERSAAEEARWTAVPGVTTTASN